MSREEWPARVFQGAQEDRPGKGERNASVGQGTSGLVDWFSGYHHHRGRSSLFPSPPPGSTVPCQQVGAKREGEFSAAHMGESLLCPKTWR